MKRNKRPMKTKQKKENQNQKSKRAKFMKRTPPTSANDATGAVLEPLFILFYFFFGCFSSTFQSARWNQTQTDQSKSNKHQPPNEPNNWRVQLAFSTGHPRAELIINRTSFKTWKTTWLNTINNQWKALVINRCWFNMEMRWRGRPAFATGPHRSRRCEDFQWMAFNGIAMNRTGTPKQTNGIKTQTNKDTKKKERK